MKSSKYTKWLRKNMVIHRKTLDVLVSDNDARSETDGSSNPLKYNKTVHFYIMRNRMVIKLKRNKYSSLNKIEITR